MGIMDDVQKTFGNAVDNARSAANEALVERAAFVKGFVRLCNDGWEQGWHERNGGNLSYRLTNDEAASIQNNLYKEPRPWVEMDVSEPSFADTYFLVTGAGCYMRNIASDPAANIGIIQINNEGNSYRVVWGFTGGAKPTSEFSTHFMVHAVRMQQTNGACRVIYHCHPSNTIALTFMLPLDSRTFSRVLWKSMMECTVVFPEGVGVVPWMLPGGAEIAEETAKLMEKFQAVIWGQHGMFVSGESFDSTFGLMHTIEKAAQIYRLARSMNGGSGDFPNTIPDEGIVQIGRRYGVKVNSSFLDV